MSVVRLNISAVERETGLSKDVLRIWERRYGFPVPERDAHGERLYPLEQVERLLQIKRLMDQGHRPGKLIKASAEELASLGARRLRTPQASAPAGDLEELIGLIRRHDVAGYQQAMQQRLARQGLLQFVQDTVAPLTWRVGEAWQSGMIEVYEEHLFTELTKRMLRQAISALPGGHSPRVLLTSLPEEPHLLGLLMVEVLLTLEGAQCIPLGTQMPLVEIGRAAQAHQADIVALSFSSAFQARQVPNLLQQLRGTLPASVALWAGGGGVQRVPAQEGVTLLNGLSEVTVYLAEWRNSSQMAQSPVTPAAIG